MSRLNCDPLPIVTIGRIGRLMAVAEATIFSETAGLVGEAGQRLVN